MQEQLTVTMPIKEYERLKELEPIIDEFRKGSCYIYHYEHSQFACTPANMPEFHVINAEKMDSLLAKKIVELQGELVKYAARIDELIIEKNILLKNKPTLWQLLKKKLNLL